MNPILKTISKIHKTVYQLSGGRLGSTMGGQNILLLHHTGAKSKKTYVTPVGYVEKHEDGNKAYVIVAAAAGQANHPGWYYNLCKTPDAAIKVKDQKIQVSAEVASSDKRDQLWAELSAEYPQFDEFQSKVTRVIPIFLLHPHSER
ncbi:MAG: nitroreductase/quinone reductase family protein [Chloroflexota bacterium]